MMFEQRRRGLTMIPGGLLATPSDLRHADTADISHLLLVQAARSLQY